MNLMDFDRFKRIIEVIQEFDKKIEKISKFFEEEMMEDSYCMITIGSNLQTTLVSMLADEFDCWYSTRSNEKPTHWWKNEKTYRSSNDIEWWLYESNDTEEGKVIMVGDKEYNTDTIEKFYDYLMEMYNKKKQEGKETEFSDNAEAKPSPEETLNILNNLFNSQV